MKLTGTNVERGTCSFEVTKRDGEGLGARAIHMYVEQKMGGEGKMRRINMFCFLLWINTELFLEIIKMTQYLVNIPALGPVRVAATQDLAAIAPPPI